MSVFSSCLEVGFFKNISDQVPVGVMVIEPCSLQIVYLNKVASLLVDTLRRRFPAVRGSALSGAIFKEAIPRLYELITQFDGISNAVRITFGEDVLDFSLSRVMMESDSSVALLIMWQQVAQQIRAEEELLRLTSYDRLTGLQNRSTFIKELTKALSSPPEPEASAGLFFVDLDGFKLINDSHGYAIGDRVLNVIARRLEIIGREQKGCVGRTGGDEFALFVPHCTQETAEALACHIIRTAQDPIILPDGGSHQIGASVGIALSSHYKISSEALLAQAHMALYDIKTKNKGNHCVFVPRMECEHRHRAELEEMLREVLPQKRNMFVFYQPIVELCSQRVVGYEALIRWYYPKRGWISPNDFIPVAEESGLIQELDRFVLTTACHEAMRWQNGAYVAVNVSATYLGQSALPELVRVTLAETKLHPKRLNIEITETALLRHKAESIRDLRALRDIGVGISLDDFGTGFSSLSHLCSFPFDKIKIDKSFVQESEERNDCVAIIRTVVQLGKALDARTVAEGVETQTHYDLIKADGCSLGQGYFFGKPAPSQTDVVRVQQIMESLQA